MKLSAMASLEKAKSELKKVLSEMAKDENKRDHDLYIKSSSQVKVSSEECKTMCKKIGLEYLEGYEDRIIQFRFTDSKADRHNEVVIASGVDLKEYKQDPVVLLQHDSWKFPVGKSLETEYYPDSDDIAGKVLFLDDRVDRTGVAEDTFQMVKSGVLKKGSIGYRAARGNVRLASEEEKKKYGLGEYGIIFDKCVLREFSIVTIPANPRAEQIAARKGLYRKSTLENLLNEDKISEEIFEALAEETEPEEKENSISLSEVIENSIFKAFENVEANKAGAVLSKKNKQLIGAAINSCKALNENLITLKTDLENLLNQASSSPSEDKSETHIETGSHDSGEEENENDLYSILDKAELRLKTLNSKE